MFESRKRCRYCGGIGHNIRTCTTLPTEHKEQISQYYRHKSCKFCREPGHNIATCIKMRQVRAEFIEQNKVFIQRYVDEISRIGWGIGSLVEIKSGYENNEIAIVNDLDWKYISLNNCRCLMGKAISNNKNCYVSFPVPSEATYGKYYKTVYYPLILRPLESRARLVSPSTHKFVIPREYVYGDNPSQFPHDLRTNKSA